MWVLSEIFPSTFTSVLYCDGFVTNSVIPTLLRDSNIHNTNGKNIFVCVDTRVLIYAFIQEFLCVVLKYL